jgi:hypothetical protein
MQSNSLSLALEKRTDDAVAALALPPAAATAICAHTMRQVGSEIGLPELLYQWIVILPINQDAQKS